ncbi:ankyrin repeat domain-containing protein [Candidatus Chromulinivorax destructor]|uniref:Uncharacterized protein n=1 Tax=Candidatus Chromulinivorax destructor TaxID=2066483 RepID=A0A345ZCV8_9BACT|nr:ankyrin repeat domain-containing protein [Candidatus Chromulinivorax destructor]AXK61125.1 hypothetical protein C0J27_05330 [Candidatus Chromulinivorax destructor]
MKNLKLLFLLAMSVGFTVQANELHDAVAANDIVKIKKLIKEGVSVHSLDAHGFTPLFRCKTKEAAQCLIENTADVNCSCTYNVYDASGCKSLYTVTGWTPLQEAINKDLSPEYILYLLDCGADVNAQSIWDGEEASWPFNLNFDFYIVQTPLSIAFAPYYDIKNDILPKCLQMTFPTLNNEVLRSDKLTPKNFLYAILQKEVLLEARSENKYTYTVEVEVTPGVMVQIF